MTEPEAPNPALARWNALRGTALGRWAFSRGLGVVVPYSGSIGPLIRHLEPGRAVIAMRDRRKVRNHLRSIHAAALLNLTELTGGLVVTVSMPADARMIITRVSLDFLKKARGLLTSEGTCPIPQSNQRAEIEVQVAIRDAAGDVVAQGTVHVLVGPIPG